MQKPKPAMAMARLALFLCVISKFAQADILKLSSNQYGPFDQSYFGRFAVQSPAMISNGALQVTPDSAGNFTLQNRTGRVLLNQSIKFWDDGWNGGQVISFNTSFLINIFRLVNQSDVPGEGLAFIIAPDLDIPPDSYGQYLGLTNSSTDGNASNHLVAVELDTFKQDFDPDDNHLGLDINSVRSVKNVSLSSLGITLCPETAVNYTVWIEYDGGNEVIDVYIAKQGVAKPSQPALTSTLDLKSIINQNSYFGFAASTGTRFELNCVLGWNLTFEEFVDGNGGKSSLIIGVAVGIPLSVVVLLLGLAGYWSHRKKNRANRSDSQILGSLQSLPGMPREFELKVLKKATDNFSEKNKLGEGGFGMVYRGLLPKENIEIAVKKFSRDNIKGRDDFLAELTIINRLRHRHLVRLVGWCIKNGMLFLVYEYMPNKSLDNHLFCGEEKAVLPWNLRYQIVTGVASALRYLHNEYDQKVVHRDLKASNIMLDSNFNARLGDFGLARALENEKTSYAEIEGVHGTIGYIAPECFHTGKATCESDIYGFGAVLLEVACGQRPASKNDGFQLLVDWVWSLHRDGRILEAVDPRLEKNYVVEEAKRILLLGLACSHPIASNRPKTQAIVQILSGAVEVPHVPPFKPSFVWPSAVSMGDDYSNDGTPITSSQYPTSEYTTSSYGLISSDINTR